MTAINRLDVIVTEIYSGNWVAYATGIRVIHGPTMIDAECSDHTSQHRNRVVAMSRLQEKLDGRKTAQSI